MPTRVFYLIKVSLIFLFASGCTGPISPTSPPASPTTTPPVVITPVFPQSSPTLITDVITRTLTMDDYHYMMECSGEGSPTVLLLGGRAETWKPIQTEIGRSNRTCVFEHTGSRSTPLTAEEIAMNVHALIKEAEIPSPYVIVGFSAGGFIARLFTNLYPEEVTGMALLEASHEDQNARFLAALPAESSEDCQELKDYRAELQRTHTLQIGPELSLDFDASAAQVSKVETDLDNLPLIVLTAGRSDWPECFSSDVKEQLDQTWLDLQKELVGLSTNSVQLTATESGHSLAEQPEMVIEMIEQTVSAVQTGNPVAIP